MAYQNFAATLIHSWTIVGVKWYVFLRLVRGFWNLEDIAAVADVLP